MAVQLGSAYGQVVIDATGVRKGTREAESALVGLEKKGSAAMAALGLSIAGMGVLLTKTTTKSVSLATEFQTSMTGVDLAAGDARESFVELHDAAIMVGDDTRLLGVSATGASDAMTGLYKSGLSTSLIFGDLQGYMAGTSELGGALRASIDLAAASELDMVQASDLASVALATFGAELETDAEKAEFINEAMDNFVKAADASVAEVSDLYAGLVNVGPEAARMGMSLQDVNNALAILSTRGIRGAEAGTALKSMMLNLNRQTDDVVEALDELDVSLYDANGTMRSLPEILGDLEIAFADLTDEQRDHYMQTLAGTYGIKALSTLVAEGTEGWYAMADATERATGIQEKAARMAETHAGRVEALEGNLETLQIVIGEKLLPVATDWVEWMIVVVDEHGPKLVSMVDKIAGGVGVLSDALQGQGTPLQNTIARMGTLGVTALGVGQAYRGLAPIMRPAITEIGTLVGDLTTKFQLMREGAKLGEVTALGWSSSLLPVVSALAAIAAWLEVINRYKKVQQDVDEGTQETQEAWVGFLEDQVEQGYSAAGVARVYARQQKEVNKILDETAKKDPALRALMGVFIDHQEIANARTEDLSDALVHAAKDYDDYLEAVELSNDALLDQADSAKEIYDAFDRMIDPLSETSFELVRGARSMETGFIAARMMTSGVEVLTDRQIIAQREAENTARVQEHANRIAASSYLDTVTSLQAAGVITRQEAGSMRSVVVDEFGQMQTATENLRGAQARLAEVAATSWETFAQNVYEGVQGALTAYREGNEEMLAEQEAALGQMVLNQAEQWAIMGKIAPSQLKTIRAAIHEEFGIAIDEAAVGRDEFLALFAEMATGGATEIENLIEFIRNIGSETEQMVEDQRQALEDSDREWMDFTNSMESYSAEMDVQFGETLGLAQQVYDQLTGLPKDHTFTLHLETEGELPSLPSGGGGYGGRGGAGGSTPTPMQHGTDYAIGGWSLVGEVGPELEYVPRGAQVLSARETLQLVSSAADLAKTLADGGLAGAAATLPTWREREMGGQVVVQMTNYLRDDLDVELMARRVAEYISERQRR